MRSDQGKKFSVIVPVYKTEDYLEKTIDSFFNQQYENFEIIVVFDGRSRKGEKILEKYHDKPVSSKNISHGGVCRARNLGRADATGDYLLFWDSDCYISPGTLEAWSKALEDYPEAVFAYSGYKFTDPYQPPYGSNQLDPYLLESANFICTMSPIRKEHAPLWDEELESLNDWDYWLTVVKDRGLNGVFVPGYGFETEPPRKGGVSENSHNNWLDRNDYIKKKHGIENRRVCVSSLIQTERALDIAKWLNADFKKFPGFKPNRYETVVMVGFYANDANSHALVLSDLNPGTKVVIHWLDLDIWQLYRFAFQDCRALVAALNHAGATHFCENPGAQEMLKEMGIEATIFPIPTLYSVDPVPLPKEFSVLATVAEGLADLLSSVDRAMPDIKFHYGENIGDGDVRTVRDYSCFMSILDMQIPTLEMRDFVRAGRFVITNVHSEHCDYVELYEAPFDEAKKRIISAIRTIQEKVEDNEWNKEGKLYYDRLVDPEIYRRTILDMSWESQEEAVPIEVETVGEHPKVSLDKLMQEL